MKRSFDSVNEDLSAQPVESLCVGLGTLERLERLAVALQDLVVGIAFLVDAELLLCHPATQCV
jgi:hypothetical protein